MLASDPVTKWMSVPRGLIDAEKSVLEACHVMAQARIGSVLVARSERVIGILTERDIVGRVVCAKLDPAMVRVQEVMSTPIVTISSEVTITDAARIMVANRVRRLPVIEGEKVVGLITSDDIARSLASDKAYEDEILNAVARYSKPPQRGPYL